MKPTQQHRTIDVTGLPEEAISVVESLIMLIRANTATGERVATPSHEEWSRSLHAWAVSHPRLESTADDSRESIYEGRGE